MAYLAKPISSSYDIANVRVTITNYFDNPMMIKCRELKNNSSQREMSVYIAKINVNLLNESRYILAFVPKDFNDIGSIYPLSLIDWECFQTRSMSDDDLSIFIKEETTTKDNTTSGNSRKEVTSKKNIYNNRFSLPTLGSHSTLPEIPIKVPSFTYVPKRDKYNTKIVIRDRNVNTTNYVPNEVRTQNDGGSIMITLLHKTTSLYEYPDKGSLYAALETYRTVITFTF